MGEITAVTSGIAAEALTKAEDPAVPGREKLAWSPVRLTYPPEGED